MDDAFMPTQSGNFSIFNILLGQQPEKAVGLFSHLIAEHLRLMNIHTIALSDTRYIFAS